jgi:competence protein ComEA
MPAAPRSQIVGYAVLAVVVLLIGGRWLAARGAHPASSGGFAGSSAPAPAPGVQVPPARREAIVHVAGAVRRPGVYRLAPGKRVEDAVKCAGGPTRHGDVNAINLAAPVQDGVQVIVPTRGASAAAAAAPAGGAAGAAPGAPVDVNTAPEAELETLDGVGPATAAKILAYRREHGGFRTVDDLLQVPGIGPKKLAAIKPRVRT